MLSYCHTSMLSCCHTVMLSCCHVSGGRDPAARGSCPGPHRVYPVPAGLQRGRGRHRHPGQGRRHAPPPRHQVSIPPAHPLLFTPAHTSYPPLPRRHHTHAALLLLHSGADFDTADSEGETAVHVCARDGQLGLAQTLCAFGCNVDVANCEGMQVHTIQGVTQYRGTPCMYSVQYLYNLCPAAAPPRGQARQHRGCALPVPGRGEHRRQEPRGGGRRDLRPGPGTAPHIYRLSTL